MGVKVAFLAPGEGGRAAPQALIPADAVREAEGKQVVFVLRDGAVERRAVSIGDTLGSDVAVLAGLTAGERVVVRGPSDLRDGERVSVKR